MSAGLIVIGMLCLLGKSDARGNTPPTFSSSTDDASAGSPEFTWGLTSLTVLDGEEAKFLCEVKAEPTPEITWFHDEKPIGENQDFIMTFEPELGKCSLVIAEVFPQDAGEYMCVAVNDKGKAITRAMLEVKSGNTNSDFAITNTGTLKVGTIAVATGKTLDDDTTTSYDIRVTVSDGTETVTATVTITVSSRAATLVPMLLMLVICVLLRN